MVTVSSYAERQNADGKKFFSLILSGDLQMVLSEETGRYYATAKTASITSTFDEATCKNLVGKQLPGRITKIVCDPYEHVIKETGQIVQLSHRWIYNPNETTTDDMVVDERSVVGADAFAL
jgi:hypothetical protein